MACTCGRIKIGSTQTELRNWHPDCPEHGVESEWWNAPEQIEKRRVSEARSAELRERAREARRAIRDSRD